MRYLVMIRSNPNFQQLWETWPDDKRMEFGRNHMALSQSLHESGELIAAEGLADPSESTVVAMRDGVAVTIDGPYAEVKEHLVGFLLIECDDRERAVQIAAQVPDAQYGEVEIRPVMDLKSIDF
ncbi:MAG TPA: YciI family protein [Jatrophihabitans sp.]|uniref:YciI family protein n=1 Tax=Jatrophihabitans sp. TaxID=1932789 RepID=UPI002F1993FF